MEESSRTIANNGWLPDGTVDWIDCAYPPELESIFAERTEGSMPGDTNHYDEDDVDDDDDTLDEEEDDKDTEN